MNANAETTITKVLETTLELHQTLVDGPTVREVYRTDETVVYKVFPAGSTNDFSAIEVRLDRRMGSNGCRLEVSHSSNRFDTTQDAVAQAAAMTVAANLMVSLRGLITTVEMGTK